MRELSIDAIVADAALSVAQKSERLAQALYALPDHGVAQAVASLCATDDARVAAFVSDYLALLPDLQAEKTRAAERLRTVPALVVAAARLVPWLAPTLLEKFIADWRANPDKRSPLYSVMFEIATFFPALLRPHLATFDSPSIRRGLMSGAPDEWIGGHLASWRAHRDIDALDAIARFRTAGAADVIAGLNDEVGDREQWERLLEMSGRLPNGSPSAFEPSFLGYVTAADKTPHVMGGKIAGPVPLCPVCGKPAERVLTLSARSLPFSLRADPSFFWFSCSCNQLDATTVQERPEGRRVFFAPPGDAGDGGHVLPGACSLDLRSHPNQIGVSVDATGGFARHQVGGPPAWIRPQPLPYCPGCRQPMKFLASIDSGVTPFGRTGFTGTLFGFWCDECAIATTQHRA